MHRHLSFTGGQDRQEFFQGDGKSMYLPAGVSGVRLWEDSVRESDIPQADSAHAGGDGGESKVKERKTQGF